MGDLIGYARVSTNDQDAALQLDALAAAGCTRTFTDTASGAAERRPELAQALDHLRAGDTLVVWRLDRLGRKLRILTDLVDDLGKRDVGLRTLSGIAIDTTSPGGRLLFHAFAALAEWERDVIAERTNKGLAAARARGRHGGRPSVMNPTKLAAARAFLAENQSRTIAEAAKEIGVGRTTLVRHLGLAEPGRTE